MRDSIFYYSRMPGFQVRLSEYKNQLMKMHDTQDFWTKELLLLTDTFSNNPSIKERNDHFQALSSTLDTADYNQVSYIYLWLPYLNKQRLEPRYYSMHLKAADKRQSKSGDLDMAYDYAVLLSMRHPKRAYHIIDSCYQLY